MKPKISKIRRKGRKRSSKCNFCIHRKDIGSYARIRCDHPSVVSILNELTDRKPGLILATALNKIGKELDLKFYPDIYQRHWFRFPFCYDLNSVKRCSGFEKEKL